MIAEHWCIEKGHLFIPFIQVCMAFTRNEKIIFTLSSIAHRQYLTKYNLTTKQILYIYAIQAGIASDILCECYCNKRRLCFSALYIILYICIMMSES